MDGKALKLNTKIITDIKAKKEKILSFTAMKDKITKTWFYVHLFLVKLKL